MFVADDGEVGGEGEGLYDEDGLESRCERCFFKANWPRRNRISWHVIEYGFQRGWN